MRKLVAALTVCLILISPANAGTLYFSSLYDPTTQANGNIHRISTEGDELQTVLSIGQRLRAVSLDPVAHKIYWIEADPGVIRRANLDGTNIQDVVTLGEYIPWALALSPSSNTLYWVDSSFQIGRATLDGEGAGYFLTIPDIEGGLAVDDVNGKIYWPIDDGIMSANLSGTASVTFLSLPVNPSDLAIDIAGGKIYWTDQVSYKVGRVNVDGTSLEILFDLGEDKDRPPGGIALDLIDRKVYWGQLPDGGFNYSSDIMRMNLDGSNPEVIATVGWVTSMVFTDSTAPILFKPLGVLDAQPPIFEWSNVGSATWYRLWVTDDTGILIKQWYKAADICSAVTCSVASQMSTMGIATWQVRGYDGTLGDWSDRGFFWDELSRPVATTLVQPLDNTSDLTPDFVWEIVDDATWYKLEIILDSSGVLIKDQWFRADGLDIDCDDGITCKVDSVSIPLSNIRWRVRTYNPAGLGPWTDYGFVRPYFIIN